MKLPLFSVFALVACTPVDNKIEAAAGYEAQQMACVDQYADKPSIDKCRARVKAQWAADASVDASEGGAR